jgi:hypothetical protein
LQIEESGISQPIIRCRLVWAIPFLQGDKLFLVGTATSTHNRSIDNGGGNSFQSHLAPVVPNDLLQVQPLFALTCLWVALQ